MISSNWTLDSLIGWQRAEFEKAASLFRRRFYLQLALVIVAIASVLVPEGKLTYWVTLSGLAIAVGAIFVDFSYRSVRSNAERARRATLIMGGLGRPISQAELSDIADSLSSPEVRAKANEDRNYFASKSPAGTQRLAEMLEESAYWTHDLQRASRAVMAIVCIVSLFGCLAALLCVLPSYNPQELMIYARIICAILVFVVGSEMIGMLRSYHDTTVAVRRILDRLGEARAQRYPDADMLLILSDYNAAVENTPLNLPWTYELRWKRITEKWKRRNSAFKV